VRDLRRTDGVSGWHRSKRTYKRERNGERCAVRSRTAEKYQKRGESHVTGNRRQKWVGEGSRRRWLGRKRRPVSKGAEEDQFHE
jgi:hypothetical protein